MHNPRDLFSVLGALRLLSLASNESPKLNVVPRRRLKLMTSAQPYLTPARCCEKGRDNVNDTVVFVLVPVLTDLFFFTVPTFSFMWQAWQAMDGHCNQRFLPHNRHDRQTVKGDRGPEAVFPSADYPVVASVSRSTDSQFRWALSP